MQDHQEEQLSAFVDDELDAPPGALLTRLVEDRASRERWARYHMIGDVLRDREVRLAPELGVRVAAALATEPALLVPPVGTPARVRSPGLVPVRRWGLAAGIAAMALLGASFVAREPAQPVPAVAEQPLPVTGNFQQVVQDGRRPQAVAWDDARGAPAANPQTVEFHRRLNSYLVNFNEQRADLGMPGVHPYVRIVGFEAEPEP
jgi:sigma-E factor negative regulatory protein RseA